MTTNDNQLRGLFDPWWERLSIENRTVLAENWLGEFDAEHWLMVMDAEPLEGQPPVVAVVSDTRTGRFRLSSLLAEYVELKANRS